MREKRKGIHVVHRTKLFSVIFLLIGVCMIFYPWISEYLYEHRVDSMSGAYEKQMEANLADDMKEELGLAEQYNEQISGNQIVLCDPFTQTESEDLDVVSYEDILNQDGNGLMGFIEIPCISVYLPVYHGTDSRTLEKGIGHLEGSSLPVGGENTNCVLSGHTGLNSAKLFTDLENVEKGDLFYLHILNQVLSYRVIGISVVEPDDVSLLKIQSERDLVTLVTCTPYGVNSHRLLVIGERTENSSVLNVDEQKENNRTIKDSEWMRNYRTAILYGVCMASGFVVICIFMKRGFHVEK